jgi:hypothetical protein
MSEFYFSCIDPEELARGEAGRGPRNELNFPDATAYRTPIDLAERRTMKR